MTLLPRARCPKVTAVSVLEMEKIKQQQCGNEGVRCTAKNTAWWLSEGDLCHSNREARAVIGSGNGRQIKTCLDLLCAHSFLPNRPKIRIEKGQIGWQAVIWVTQGRSAIYMSFKGWFCRQGAKSSLINNITPSKIWAYYREVFSLDNFVIWTVLNSILAFHLPNFSQSRCPNCVRLIERRHASVGAYSLMLLTGNINTHSHG